MTDSLRAVRPQQLTVAESRVHGSSPPPPRPVFSVHEIAGRLRVVLSGLYTASEIPSSLCGFRGSRQPGSVKHKKCEREGHASFLRHNCGAAGKPTRSHSAI